MGRKAVEDNNESAETPPENTKPNSNKLKDFLKKVPYKRWQFWAIIGTIMVILITVVTPGADKNTEKYAYEEYDIKGLTVKEACEKVRNEGWEVEAVRDIEDHSDKTDCYNENKTVSDYDYYKYSRSVYIYYGEKKTDEQKQNECEAAGKWYRDGDCKTQEEWENDYKWKDAHSACKKYGANAYAKTLTDCYVGNEYMGKVDGQPQQEQSKTEVKSQTNSNSNSEWKQLLKDYEAWVDDYVDFMKKYKTASGSDLLSMMSDYTDLLSEMTEWSEKVSKMQKTLSGSDLTAYLNTMSRITKKLNSIK